MSLVAIVDYGMCNLDSIGRAVEECGGNSLVTDNPKDLNEATHIILPGVGALPDAMENLRALGFDSALDEQVVDNSIPFLGICLGMHMMARRGFEGKETDGLGWIDADVVRLEPNGEDTRIPHIGWNEVYPTTDDSPLFENFNEGTDLYFVHSYHLKCDEEDQVLARTPYGAGFVSAVSRGNLFGVQFHPEKSQKVGFQVLRNFLSF